MSVVNFVKQSAISSLAGLLADGKTFTRIRELVSKVEDPNVPGTDKKTAVLAELQKDGLAIAGWLGNLLIELAVSYIRLQSGK